MVKLIGAWILVMRWYRIAKGWYPIAKRIYMAAKIIAGPWLCEHANENPNVCPCDAKCYCKKRTCAPKSDPGPCKIAERETAGHYRCTRGEGHEGPCAAEPCTLEGYLKYEVSQGKIDFSARANSYDGHVEIYIHPSNRDGTTTPSLKVQGNQIVWPR